MNQKYSELAESILSGKPLAFEEAKTVMGLFLEEAFTPVQAGVILTALRMRGETGDELAGFSTYLRERAIPFFLPAGTKAVDTCGTGGDGAGTFNISTAAALLACACGLAVVKHGNRAVSSPSGSADFLESLGIKIDLSPFAAGELLRETGFTFLYAPNYHPSVKAVQKIRQELGIRTVFNILGPLINPAPICFKLMGVYDHKLLPLVSEALKHQGVERAMVVWGEPGLDEVSPCGYTRAILVEKERTREFSLLPRDAGIEACSLEDLRGGESKENADKFLALCEGRERGPLRGAVILNTAVILWLAGKAENIKAARFMVENILDSGIALDTIRSIIRVSRVCAEGG